jgi:hypothetical protein
LTITLLCTGEWRLKRPQPCLEPCPQPQHGPHACGRDPSPKLFTYLSTEILHPVPSRSRTPVLLIRRVIAQSLGQSESPVVSVYIRARVESAVPCTARQPDRPCATLRHRLSLPPRVCDLVKDNVEESDARPTVPYNLGSVGGDSVCVAAAV